MPAPKNNDYWRQRSKHGRDKIFADPDAMREACREYFLWCEENPLLETQFVGKDAIQVVVPKMRPFTLTGLCLFMHVDDTYLTDFEARLNPNHNKALKLEDKEREGVSQSRSRGRLASCLRGQGLGLLCLR